MISDTKIHKIGSSYMVLIPEKNVKYHQIDKMEKPRVCQIEDLGENEAKLTFPSR